MLNNTAFAQNEILQVINRVIQHSGRSPAQFYTGLIWQIIERCLGLVPIVICYFWLVHVLSHDNAASADSLLPLLLVLALLGVFLLQLLFANWGLRNSFVGSYHIMGGYREQTLNRVHQLPLGTLHRYRVGQLSDVLTDDINRVETIFTHLAAELFATAAIPLMFFLVLLWVDWRLTLALAASFPFALLVLSGSRRLFVHMSRQKQETFRDTAGLLVEFVTGIKSLRLFNRADQWLSRLYQQFDYMTKMSLGVEAWGAGPVVLYRLLVELGLVFLLLVCALLVGSEGEQPLTWLLFLLLAHKLIAPLLEMAEHLTVMRYAIQSERKIEALRSEAVLAEPTQPQQPQGYQVQFDHVQFAYDAETVLHDLSFTVPANTITAIVGPSGAGKSTVMHLLARFYEPSAGTVSLGGVDIRAIGTDGLYQHVSMVFQQVQLYDGTIMENIRIGRPEASDEDVVAACQAAYCDGFIQALPDGYNTRIGESGQRLSGGERQRLSIARALLKDAPVLLLDEATASVDPQAQYEIQTALSRLAVGRTVIMIAHRLSTVRDADQILVLDQGRMVEEGTHQSLLQHKGLYKTLWEAQNTGMHVA